LSPGSRLVRGAASAPVLLLTAPDADARRTARLEAAGVEIEQVPRDPAGGLDLVEALGRLKRRDLAAILCEGGGELAGRMLAAGLVQRLVLFVAPIVLGPAGVAAFGRRGAPDGWALVECRPVGRDALLVWESSELEAITGAD
jgi:diaminohydroxyphosphoribosylaminopyrimidine deaminase / 5-amino-6-(5-phosphoribosylamino)uracil reductase